MSRHKPTEEQAAIVNAAVEMVSGTVSSGGAIKTLAGAGTGKTSTLVSIGRSVKDRFPKARILYLGYNREIKIEAEAKFGNLAESYTVNGIAFRSLGINSLGRKVGNLYKGNIRDILGNHLSDSDVNLVMTGLKNFTQSAAPWPTKQIFPARADGILVSDKRKESLLPYLEQLLAAVLPENKNSSVPLPHDIYLKYWQMIGSPGLDDYDLVMLDEAQDANPVILASLEGAGRSIYVGDSQQAIYQWRNAVDALQQVYGRPFPMTQSFRFGAAIAELANDILSYKHDKPEHLLKGFDSLDTIIAGVDRKRPHARIYRTNRALIREALLLMDRNISFSIAGNNDEVSEMIESVWNLKLGNMRGVRHPLVRWLKTWDAALAEVEKGGEVRELNQAISVVEEFGERVPEVIGMLKQKTDESRAHVILTTAHRSKGREFDNVIISPDFDPILERAKTARFLWDAEMNLLYVAVTRAMRCLEVNCEWVNNIINAKSSVHY